MRELEFKARLGCRGGGGEARGTGEFGGFTRGVIVEEDRGKGGLETSLLSTGFTMWDGGAEVRGRESEGSLIMDPSANTTDPGFDFRRETNRSNILINKTCVRSIRALTPGQYHQNPSQMEATRATPAPVPAPTL